MNVVSLTTEPSSVKPEVLLPWSSVPQKTLPEESVSRTPVPVQERIVEIASPPVCTWRPPLKVEDADPDTRSVEEAWRSPLTPRDEEMVEEDCETKPALKVPSDWARKAPEEVSVLSTVEDPEEINPFVPNVASPVTASVEEAFNAPETWRVEAAVDEAWETNPEARVASESAWRVE